MAVASATKQGMSRRRFLLWRSLSRPPLLQQLIFLTFLWPAAAPVPCGQDLRASLVVGGVRGTLGFSRTPILHNELEERMCSIINGRYEGMIVLGCWEGEINGTTEDCVPRHCPLYTSTTVSVGDKTINIMPTKPMEHTGMEVRLCREVNPVYRKKFYIFCNFGELTADVSECDTQWHRMPDAPWSARSQHTALTLSDGAVLMLGGLAVTGPIRDVWEWKPDPRLPELTAGVWTQHPTPPWSARFGIAAAWQAHAEAGEQVTILGGNDGLNRKDVWRWLRKPTRVRIRLEDSDVTGTQQKDCELARATGYSPTILTCNPSQGVQGRRWYIPHELEPSSQVYVDLKYNSTTEAVAIVALQIDKCRIVLELRGGQFSSRGCTVERPLNPPWSTGADLETLGPDDAVQEGLWHSLRIDIDREAQMLHLHLDDEKLAPVGGNDGIYVGPPLGTLCVISTTTTTTTTTADFLGGSSQTEDSVDDGDVDTNSSLGRRLSEQASSCTAKASSDEPLITDMALKTIEIAAWPGARIQVKDLGLRAPPGHWQQLVEYAPWVARTLHAAVALPDGDLLMCGGLSGSEPLNDVWRWVPQRCTLLPELGPEDALQYELECGYECKASEPWGQWKRLENAPWEPRYGHSLFWTAIGVLLIGGRTDSQYTSDVWRWMSGGAFCSLEWQGRWLQLQAAASFAPRYGHRLVGFATQDRPRDGISQLLPVDTLLVIAGFGGEPPPPEVVLPEDREDPIQARYDLWCGNLEKGNFSEWAALAPVGPFLPRVAPAAVVAPTMGQFRLMMFGGFDSSARPNNDQWRWAGDNSTSECAIEQLDT